MDREIERQQRMTIPEIFEKYGEEYFRNLETEFLRNFRDEACIIATGGGVAMKEENRKIMRRTGLVFFLDADFNEIYERIKNDPNRPIVQSSTKEQLKQLYHNRKRYYRKACHIRVFTKGKSMRKIVEYIGYQVNRLKGE